MQPLRSGKLL
ncbi:hypothetical protein F383_36904 [Gossypium arboreum]|uniref:Uncharacterized protein n=1 Tax=Gossypium arboreum TaxID=29729 RepID=A0A0B0Q0H7_GOSAR|nr:hypothetical protein F383_36904 [Gossypium arboreum]